MKLRRFCSLFLAVCLVLSLAPAALAAPTRDPQRAEVTLDPGLQTLVELALGAAVLRDVPALEEGDQPTQALVEGVLALGLYSLALPCQGEKLLDNRASLTEEEIADYYRLVFTAGQYARPDQSTCPCITLTEKGAEFDLEALRENPVIGAFIYSTAFDGETVQLQCDLYTYYGEAAQSAEALPEDALTWLCNARVSLRYAPDSAYGYTLNGFSLSDTYQDGMLYDWNAVENTEYEYSVSLPSILGLAEADPQHRTWQTADGDASVTIDVITEGKTDYDAALSAFLLSHPGQTVTEEGEFSQFYAVGEGVFTLCIVPEELPWAYTLTLEFPPERQEEFTLYAEFIRNSMIAWGVSNG